MTDSDLILTSEQLQAMGDAMYPGVRRWRHLLAQDSGLSPSSISGYLNGRLPITAKASRTLVSLFNRKGAQMPPPGAACAPETDEEIFTRIGERFRVLRVLVESVICGNTRSLIVFGPAGIGKTYVVEEAFRHAGLVEINVNLIRQNKDEAVTGEREFCHEEAQEDPVPILRTIKGSGSPVGLFEALYETSENGILFLDDADEIYSHKEALMLLKAALDTNGLRIVSWQKQNPELETKDIPRSFQYDGRVIFLTNTNIEREAKTARRTARDYEALLSRSKYLDLTIHSKREQVVWTERVFLNGMHGKEGLGRSEAMEIVNFVREREESFREISLRSYKHLSEIYKEFGPRWQEIAEATLTRQNRISVDNPFLTSVLA